MLGGGRKVKLSLTVTRGSCSLRCVVLVSDWELVAAPGSVPSASPQWPIPPRGFDLLSLPDVTSVIELLTQALNCISHCPPGALYGRVCRLLALATGARDPLCTAYLLAESVAVTTRHQLLAVTHRKMR